MSRFVHKPPFARGALLAAALSLPVPATTVPLADAPAALQEQGAKRDVSSFNLEKGGLALSGYDPVAYHSEGGGKPLAGSKEHEHVHQGVRYRFASAKNLETFKKDPARYEPLYGGWCAYAMASGEKVEIDPKSFLITDGKLLVFYKGLFNDTRAKWQKDPEKLKARADAAWKKLNEPKPRPKESGR